MTIRIAPRAGQTVLPPVASELAPSEQIRTLYRLGDPGLSELSLEEFLDELLVRVRDALAVDTVAILLLDEETDQLVARAAKGVEEEVEQGVRIPIGQGFAGRIAAERVAIYIADVDHADILNPILRAKGIRSLLGIPLIVEGDLIGVLHVGSLKPRTFTVTDLAVLQFAAARAAPGIERARLSSALEHEHRVAMVLQRSLLPTRLAEVFGVSASARYLPASDGVGGDWYDFFELPRGLTGVAIGDVVGHGVKAAATMGQLRTALQAYAMEGLGPARTLELVDRFVQARLDFSMATAAYGVLDPESGVLRLASAGHLPPIIVGRGEARLVDLPVAPPLGAFPYSSSQELEMKLEAGDILLLYTDGLVERRGIPLSHSLDGLRDVVRRGSSAEDVCRRAIDQLPLDGLGDDVAMVAVENGEVPVDLRLKLPATLQTLAPVRRAMRRWLYDRGGDENDIMEITLAVSEACSNAVEHAYSPAPAELELHASECGAEVTIVVTDGGRWRAPRRRNRGRGLKIMESAMDTLDVISSEAGTQVVLRRKLRR